MLFFLDIDGVMVPAKGWKSPEFLNDSKFSMEEWKNIFKNRGINIQKIKALPENFHNLSRKDEIVNWFNVNNVNEDFVIIDDDDKSLNELPVFLKENLIQTSPYIGLTEEHSEAIKSISYKRL